MAIILHHNMLLSQRLNILVFRVTHSAVAGLRIVRTPFCCAAFASQEHHLARSNVSQANDFWTPKGAGLATLVDELGPLRKGCGGCSSSSPALGSARTVVLCLYLP